jgi:DNA replication protein DnaC
VSEVCERCGGQGYRIEAGPETAVPARCECQGRCEVCGGQGFVVDDRGGYRVQRRCRCQSLDARLRLFARAGIPRRFSGCTLETYVPAGGNQATVRSIVQDFQDRLADGGEGLLLAGAPGVGKTHLLTALVTHVTIELGIEAAFVDFFELLARLRNGFGKGHGEGEILEPLLAHPVIAIDELGKGKNSEWELAVLDQLVSRAYNLERTLLVTTNYLPDEQGRAGSVAFTESLRDRVGDRVYSRLSEMCRFLAVQGPDRRQSGRRL